MLLTFFQQQAIIIAKGALMLNQLLHQLNFSDKEIRVYVAILEQGKITPAELAQTTGINRTTIYTIAKGLIRRGVISEDLGEKSSQLVALSPKDLENIIKSEEKQLNQRRQIIEKAVGELQNIAKASKYIVPKITFIDEEHLEDYLYKQGPKWNESILSADGTWWGFQDPTFVEHYQGWIEAYWKLPTSSRVSLKLLTTETDIEEVMRKRHYPNRKMKFWKGSNFTGSTWINGDHLIMIVTNKRPHYLVEIHDKVLAHNMRELFKGIWAMPSNA